MAATVEGDAAPPVGQAESTGEGPSFANQFRLFAKFGDCKSTGEAITLSNSDKWMKQAKVIDKRITTVDTGIYYKMVAKTKRALTAKEYDQFLETLAKNKKAEVDAVKQKMTSCGPPATSKTTAPVAMAAVSRLTDHTKYTGSHKLRFDEAGKMADDLSANLQNYQIQLQQVEAALTNEPSNEELLKLKSDLQEVIHLTTELLAASTLEKTSSEQAGTSKAGPSSARWKAGQKCMAPWSEDGQYYEATIDELTKDGQCNVSFLAYGNTDVCDVEQLRPFTGMPGLDTSSMSKKQRIQAEKEYKKKKAQKKATRMKEMEQEREKEKNKWHNFNSKALNKKGHIKKSIFASPDNINGRVGIGTCGIGGRPMTEFQQQEKWRKGTQAGTALSKLRAQPSYMM